jgi:hypothetical protein
MGNAAWATLGLTGAKMLEYQENDGLKWFTT